MYPFNREIGRLNPTSVSCASLVGEFTFDLRTVDPIVVPNGLERPRLRVVLAVVNKKMVGKLGSIFFSVA